MMTSASSVLPILLLILSLTQIDASQYQSIRQKRQTACETPNGILHSFHLFTYYNFSLFFSVDPCLFVNCENGGTCFKDLTTTYCYQCQCSVGYTGKTCETTAPVLRKHHSHLLQHSLPLLLAVGCSPGCLNGGICNGNICQCPPEYSGSLCQTRSTSLSLMFIRRETDHFSTFV